MPVSLRFLVAVASAALLLGCRTQPPSVSRRPSWMDSSISKMVAQLTAKYGEAQRARLERGLKQVAGY
ncbi:MAG TPA: hypothetical protein VLH09_08220, partial [Bryobacteraceae bacterium]|nr:hypothetical protein [Bryobacteraceae bacterium]